MAVSQSEIDAMRARLATSRVPTSSEAERLRKRLSDVQPLPDKTFAEEIGRTGEAVARGVAAGATFNFADEIGGALGAADEFLRRAVPGGSPGEFAGKPLGEALVARFEQEKEASQREMEALRDERPASVALGEVAGSVLTPVPGAGMAAGLVAKGAKALGQTGAAMRIAKPAAQAALGGALSGLGEGEGLERVTEAAKGAAIGGAIGGAMRAVPEVLPAKLRKIAEENAVKAIGVRAGITNKMRQMGFETAEDVKELGRKALDLKILTPGATKDQVLANSQALKEQAGEKIGEVTERARQRGLVFDFVRAQREANKPLLNLPSQSYRPKVIGPATEFVEDVATQAALTRGADSFPGARQLKTAAQKSVNWADYAPEAPRLKREVVQAFTKDFKKQVTEQLGAKQGQKLEKANKLFGVASDIEELATEAATREAAARQVGLIGALGGVGAASAIGGKGGLAAGAAIPFLEKFARERGPAYAAVYADRVGKFLQKHGSKLQALERGGTTGRAVANFVLTQRDPEYRRDAEALEKELQEAGATSGQ